MVTVATLEEGMHVDEVEILVHHHQGMLVTQPGCLQGYQHHNH